MPRRLRRCARAGRGSLIEHPCSSNELARVVRATFTGIRPALAAANGDPKITSRIKSKGAQRFCSCFGFCAQERAALVSPGPHCVAVAAGGNARRGGAMDRADSVVWTGMCSQRNPAADADPARRMRAGRNALGCVLFGYFLLHKQEKVTRSPQVSGSP